MGLTELDGIEPPTAFETETEKESTDNHILSLAPPSDIFIFSDLFYFYPLSAAS